FTPTHTSSPHFSTYVGSGLQSVLPAPHPGHGSITRFRAYARILKRPCQTRVRCGSTIHSLTLAYSRNSPVSSASGTPSRIKALRLLVGTPFQVLLHSPLGVLLTSPSRYWFTIGH